jgi:hypothetical protein
VTLHCRVDALCNNTYIFRKTPWRWSRLHRAFILRYLGGLQITRLAVVRNVKLVRSEKTNARAILPLSLFYNVAEAFLLTNRVVAHANAVDVQIVPSSCLPGVSGDGMHNATCMATYRLEDLIAT